jgi:hypothetical protein
MKWALSPELILALELEIPNRRGVDIFTAKISLYIQKTISRNFVE